MKSENLSDLSLEELTKKEKELKDSSKWATAVLILSPILLLVLLMQKMYGTAFFVKVMCLILPLFLIFSTKKQLKDIKTEIEKRS